MSTVRVTRPVHVQWTVNGAKVVREQRVTDRTPDELRTHIASLGARDHQITNVLIGDEMIPGLLREIADLKARIPTFGDQVKADFDAYWDGLQAAKAPAPRVAVARARVKVAHGTLEGLMCGCEACCELRAAYRSEGGQP